MELPSALWVYKTSVKMVTKLSPFHLIFGKEALLPMEIELPATKLLEKSIFDVENALSDKILYLQLE